MADKKKYSIRQARRDAADFLGVRDATTRATEDARDYSAQTKQDDSYEDTLRHILLGGLIKNVPGQENNMGKTIASKFINTKLMESDGKESEVDINNNKYGSRLRDRLIDSGDSSEEGFIKAAKAAVEQMKLQDFEDKSEGTSPRRSTEGRREVEMKTGGLAKQMELFEPVERGFNEGGDTSSAKDAAMQDLQSSAADKTAARKDQFDKLTDMLMSGEIKDMPEEQQQKFIKLYKMMKSQGFNEGGLMDEGGMVDEESGNEVPPGSLREEVRDDIPAQLSEGEFVFPADVVRYIGLENLMRMRQEAKQGLSQMEAMGQMGNSEEAVVQDDLPFDMYDLDIDDEEEYNSDELKMQQGGMVPSYDPRTGTYSMPGTGMGGFQPAQQMSNTGFTPYTGTQPYMQPLQYTGTQYTTADQTTNIPTFGQMVGSGYQGSELRTYVNDAGQVLQIPFVDGNPVYPIPDGYKPKGDQPQQETKTTVTPTVGQAQMRDEGGERGKDGAYQGSTVALGGKSGTGAEEGLRVGHDLVGVSFNTLKTGLAKIPGMIGGVAGIADFYSRGGQLRPGETANFFDRNNPNVSVTVNAEDYNMMKAADYKGPLAENYKAAVRAVSAIQAGDITGYENLPTDRFGNRGNSVRDLVQAATVKSLVDKMDIANLGTDLDGFLGNISNLSTGTFEEAVDKLNDAERSVLEDMGVDLDSGTFGDLSDTMGDFDFDSLSDSGDFDDPSDFDDDGKSDSAPSRTDTTIDTSKDYSGFDTKPGDFDRDEPSGNDSKDDGRSSQGFGGTDSPSGGPGCFAAGTKFFMQDGSLKSVEDIKVGDTMMDGGKVRLAIIGDGSKSDWYTYGITKVTGTHPVREQGVWKFIRDAENAIPAETEDLLYTITNENHRMVAEDKIVYSDYDMVDEDGIEEELLEMMNLQEVVEEAA